MEMRPIRRLAITLLVMSSMCFAEDTLRLPNPQSLAKSVSDPISILADAHGGGTMPKSVFIDVSSGVVVSISFHYNEGIGFDKAFAAVDTTFKNRPGNVVHKALPQFAVWADLDKRFSVIADGGTNLATVTLQSLAPGTLEYMLFSQGVSPAINDHQIMSARGHR